MELVADTPVATAFTPGIPLRVPNPVVPINPETTTFIPSFQGP